MFDSLVQCGLTPVYFLKFLPGKLPGKFLVDEKAEVLHLKGNAAEQLDAVSKVQSLLAMASWSQ